MNLITELSRKVRLKHLLISLLFIFGCNGYDQNKSDNINSKKEIANKQIVKIDGSEIKEFIFGYFCGECLLNCAPMFKLSIDSNNFKLFADYDESYFKSQDSLNFKLDLNDNAKIIIAKQILNKLPKSLYKWESNKKKFGCPDCNDGCGVYIEFTKNSNFENTKKFYLDLKPSSKNPKEMENYANYVYFKICELRKNDDSIYMETYDKYKHKYEN